MAIGQNTNSKYSWQLARQYSTNGNMATLGNGDRSFPLSSRCVRHQSHLVVKYSWNQLLYCRVGRVREKNTVKDTDTDVKRWSIVRVR